jgi:hypothetical protein
MVRRSVILLGLLLVFGCGRDVVFLDPPPYAGHADSTGSDTTGSDTTDTDTTTARRVDLSITVTIDPTDTALATRLGIVGGRLSGAQVTATRFFGLQVPLTGITDSLGEVTLAQLIEGLWTIRAIRALSGAERARLDSLDRDVTGFGGAYQGLIDDARSQATVVAGAGRQGTLVVSEGHLPYPTIASATGSEYLLGQYIEVHNNSFDTVYLDGKILGRSMPFVADGTFFPCSSSARWREDSLGIWSRQFWAFPGRGTDHPLVSGRSVIVATDAIDHTAIGPGLLDLSSADFEFIGRSDVDNPAVPNMENLGVWSDFPDFNGHGPWWVSDATMVDNLPVQSPRYVRIPRAAILDVLTSGSVPEHQSGAPYCRNFVHPSFDRRFAELIDGMTGHSLVRMALAGAPLQVLQRTKVSAADFTHGAPSPQWVP